MNKSIIFWLSVLFVFSGGAVVWSAWKLSQALNAPAATKSVTIPTAPPPGSDADILKEFTLTDRSGETLCSRDLEGKVWVASFFFATCKGSCRVQNLELASLHRKYAPQGIKFVSITCDPQTDTVEALGPYAAGFGARPDSWYFLTGDLPYIRRIGAEIFGVHVDKMVHMDRFIVVDKWGGVRGHFDWHEQEKLEQLKQLLVDLPNETQPPAKPFAETLANSEPIDANEDGIIDSQEKDAASGRSPAAPPAADSQPAEKKSSDDTESTGTAASESETPHRQPN
jgi:protein SCO1